MTKNFAVLETGMSPEARARSDALHRELVAEMSLKDSHPADTSVWDALSDTEGQP